MTATRGGKGPSQMNVAAAASTIREAVISGSHSHSRSENDLAFVILRNSKPLDHGSRVVPRSNCRRPQLLDCAGQPMTVTGPEADFADVRYQASMQRRFDCTSGKLAKAICAERPIRPGGDLRLSA